MYVAFLFYGREVHIVKAALDRYYVRGEKLSKSTAEFELIDQLFVQNNVTFRDMVKDYEISHHSKLPIARNDGGCRGRQ